MRRKQLRGSRRLARASVRVTGCCGQSQPGSWLPFAARTGGPAARVRRSLLAGADRAPGVGARPMIERMIR